MAPESSILFPSDGELYPIASSRHTNASINDLLVKTDADCKRRCVFFPCSIDFTRTALIVKTRGNKYSVALMTPNQPHTRLTSLPSMSFIDFFSLLSSCVGTWFGVSFLSLGLLTAKPRAQTHKQRQSRQ